MGFSPNEIWLEIFFHFDLFSCSNKGFFKSKWYQAQKGAELNLLERDFRDPYKVSVSFAQLFSFGVPNATLDGAPSAWP